MVICCGNSSCFVHTEIQIYRLLRNADNRSICGWCVCVYVCVCVWYTCVCMYVCMYVCVCVCVFKISSKNSLAQVYK